MICITIDTTSQFRKCFEELGRQNQFSWNAFDALFDYYGQISEDDGRPFKMDVIGICCDWCEYGTMQEAAEAYDIDEDIDRDDNDAIFEWFQDNQHAIEVKGGGILVAG